MKFRRWTACLGISLLILIEPATISAQDKAAGAKVSKKILVELYTSQGCDSCPSANDFLGDLEKLGYGPDRIVSLAFHVDYFNEPWKDPFSSPEFSRREMAYNSVQKRDDLYFTPMMMVDGRTPMLGSNRPTAIAAMKAALAEKPGVSLKMSLSESVDSRTATLDIAAPTPEAANRTLMVGLAVTEGPIVTRVKSGENRGKALKEPSVVRAFSHKTAKLAASGSSSLTFPIKLPSDAIARNCRVTAFVQDYDNGKVYQAEALPWIAPAEKR